MAALARASATDAVTIAVPFPVAVTRPDASTAATEALSLDQVTEAPGIACPFWSRTAARSRAVSPKAVNAAIAGVTVTVVGRGTSGVGVGSVASPPQAWTPSTAANHVAPKVRIRSVRYSTLTVSPSLVVLDPVALAIRGVGARRATDLDARDRLSCFMPRTV